MQKRKMAVWGGLTKNCEKKRSEKKRARIRSNRKERKEDRQKAME